MCRSLSACLLLAFISSQPRAEAHLRRPPPTPEEIAWSRQAAQVRAALGTLKNAPPVLPPALNGVADLSFADFFAPVVGPRGLAYSARLQALDGHRVRICGYMVKQQTRTPGLFLLTPLPVATDEPEYGPCDDLPASTLHVRVPSRARELIPLAPGRLVLTGRLELGPRVEADDRPSIARLILDPEPPPSAAVTAAQP